MSKLIKSPALILLISMISVSFNGCSIITDMRTVNTDIQNSINESNALINCSFSIDCSAIKELPDIPESIKDVIPEDYSLFSSDSYTIEQNSTILYALSQIAKENNIQIECDNGYVKSIGNIAEKDCGDMSGWGYTVNGEYPSVGCDEYIIQDGDVITWTYFC